MKSLVLAEKPSVGRDLGRVLKCHPRGRGFMEGDKYVVTWALGHLVTLAEPEVYDAKFKRWNLEYHPMMPDKMKLKVIKQTSQQFRTVKSLLQRKDISEVIIATDAGREGELVARWTIM
ncbi:MAG: DNA topoisomerase III, partial [Candidatus Cloacimonadota bacterium]